MAQLRRMVLAGAALMVGAVVVPVGRVVSVSAEVPLDSVTRVIHGAWVPAGAMNHRDYDRITMRLRDGRVLLAGGSAGDRCRSAAELYHPRTNRWTTTAPMHVPRCSANTIMLAGGRFLVAGGWGGTPLRRLRSAEIYHPRSGTWSLTGRLNVSRDAAAIARLPHGAILLAGGFGPRLANPLSAAEIYHPTTHRWTMTAPLAHARADINAAVLEDGDILVAGGYGDRPAARSSERYDVSAHTWRNAGRLTTPRAPQLATLPSGRVLAVGGDWYVSRHVDVYQPRHNRWVARPQLPYRWTSAPLALVHGYPAIIGGNGHGVCRTTVYVYLPGSGQWSRRAPMPTPRCEFSVASLRGGSILVAGGTRWVQGTERPPTASAIRFYPSR